MACNLDEVKRKALNKADNVFIGNMKAFKKTRDNTFFGRFNNDYRWSDLKRFAQTGANRVSKEMSKLFGKDYSEGWVTINDKFSDGVMVKIQFPKNLEKAYEKKIERQLAEERAFQEFSDSNTYIKDGEVLPNYGEEAVKAFIETNYQVPSTEGQVASEKTIRDLAARMSDRIGVKYKIVSDRTKVYKGKIDGVAHINLAYATLDTPIHEILGHPIIRAIKNGTELSNFKYKIKELNDSNAPGKFQVETYSDENLGDVNFFDTEQEAKEYVKSLKLSQPKTQLYQNLLKELEYGKGKEVLDRIKRDYITKKQAAEKNNDYEYEGYIYTQRGTIFSRYNKSTGVFEETTEEKHVEALNYYYDTNKVKYTLEEQQEEAIVELLGLMTAEKLDKVKDGKLISLLKRLLKEMKAFMKQLLGQKEVEIDKLPDNMTLGDIANLLAYSNSKLILSGNEVIYTTPDNQRFKTYQEASNHISQLTKSVEDVDLSNIELKGKRNIKLPDYFQHEIDKAHIYIKDNQWYYESEGEIEKISEEIAMSYYLSSEIDKSETIQSNIDYDNSINKFIEKNKEYEQSKEIIEEWKKVNNIQYNPEEVYSRGQGFYSIAGAFADFDVKLMFQNLLAHIEDNKKAGGQFTISATTDIPDHSKSDNSLVNKNYGKNIYYKIYPKSEDILWATPEDCASGSVIDAAEKVGSKLGKELTGVSYTKFPALRNINKVQSSLAETLDKTNTNRNFYNYNELGINLTTNNFRLEYDEGIPYSTKKIIDSINSILDQKYGKLVEPKISESKVEKYIVRESGYDQEAGEYSFDNEFKTLKEAEDFIESRKQFSGQRLKIERYKGIQPIQTNETLKESVESIKNKLYNNRYEIELKNYNQAQQGIIPEYYSGYSNLNGKLESKVNVFALNLPTVKNEVGMWQKDEDYNTVKDYIVGEAENIHGVKFWILSNEFKQEALNSYKNPTKGIAQEKEYTEQALINTKITKLKEVAKKYPRSLIRSEVKSLYNPIYKPSYEDDLLFQRIPSTVNNKSTNNTFFNINKIDKKRKQTYNNLTALLIKTLSNIKVEVVNPDTGVVEIKPIEINTLAQYKAWFSKKYPNDTFDALGAANMVDSIMAYSKDDGITLPEEALHFIVEVIYNSTEVQELLNLRDTNGIRIFEKIPLYQDNFRDYMELYKDSTKVDKEILGKLLAQYIYDKKKVNSISNKLAKLLDNILNFFFKNLRNNYATDMDIRDYPIEFRKILGIIDEKITKQEYINAKNQAIIKYNPQSLNVTPLNPADNLKKITNSLENMITRLDQTIKNSPNKGKEWTDYKVLFNNLGMAKDVDDGVHLLTSDRINDFKNAIDKSLALDPTNPDLILKAQQIRQLEKHYNIFEKSRLDTQQIYSYEFRLSKIKKYINLKQYEEGLNIFLFGTGNTKGEIYGADFDYNKYGAIYDMFKAFTKVKELDAIPELIRSEHISHFSELLSTYGPIIDIIDAVYMSNGDKLFENDDFRNNKAGEALKLIKEYRDDIRLFLDSDNTHYNARRNANLDILSVPNANEVVDKLVNKSQAKLFTEMSVIKLALGAYSRASDSIMGIFDRKLKGLEQRINQVNYDTAVNFFNGLNALGYDKLSAKDIERIFYQLDSKGIPTGYINSERDIAQFTKDKIEFTKQIPNELQDFVNTHKDPNVNKIYIPKDYGELVKMFIPIYALEKTDKKNLSPEMKALWEVRDKYSTLWGDWHLANSEQFTEQEAKDFLADVKKDLSLYHYNKLYNDSVKTYTRLDGSEVTYYTGALSRPKKINPTWSRLSQAEKNLATYYADQIRNLKLKAQPEKYNQEWFLRAPQISKTTIDAITGKQVRATFSDKIKGVFSTRVDDDFYNRDSNNEIVRLPPLRYNSKLEDPRLLTNDIMRSFALYSSNINARNIFIPEIQDLQGLVDSVKLGEVEKSSFIYDSTRETGANSNLVKAMNNLLETVVYGDRIRKSSTSTFFINTKEYLSNKNLAYNMPSMVTSALSAEIDKFTNAYLNDIFNKEELAAGRKRYAKELPQILKDFEAPIKTTVLGSLAISMGIGNSVVDNFTNTNISKGSRVVMGSIKPFSGWNALEMLQSVPLIATMGESMRLIDGIWMTRQSYNATSKEDAKKKKEIWNKAEKLLDKIKVVDGVITFDNVPDNIIDLFYIRTRSAITQMSQSLTPSDKGLIHRHAFFSILTSHMSWAILQYDNMFGVETYDYQTDQVRRGYMSKQTAFYLKDVFVAAVKDTIKTFKSQSLSFDNVVDLFDYSRDPNNEVNVRNVKRILIHMATVSTLSLIGYMLTSLALDDEDDDELSFITQILTLLVTKVAIEQRSKISFTDFGEYLFNPLSNVDSAFGQFQILDYIHSSLFSDDDDVYTKDNVYKGMDKDTVQLIRSLPFKGIFENYLGWWINPILGGELSGEVSEQTKSFKSKRETLKGLVLEKTGSSGEFIKTGLEAYSLPSKLIGYTIGENTMQLFDSPYYKNSSYFNNKLPSKKAAKIDD